jgi:hypothetical protein
MQARPIFTPLSRAAFSPSDKGAEATPGSSSLGRYKKLIELAILYNTKPERPTCIASNPDYI